MYDNVLPFWLEKGVDRDYTGILTGLDRQGVIIEQDKSVWFQGRAAWSFAAAYCMNADEGLLRAAESAELFSDTYCYDSLDRRMYFRMTREGQPLIKRRYVFSECFAAIAKAMLARAYNDPMRLREADQLLRRVLSFLEDPLDPKVDPDVRPTSGLAYLLILINVAQEIREAYVAVHGSESGRPYGLGHRSESGSERGDGFYSRLIGDCIVKIQELHVKPEFHCVLEQAGAGGDFLKEHFEGRLVNPGHSIEAAWFILREADYLRGEGNLLQADGADGHDHVDKSRCREYIRLGSDILDWMLAAGWDERYGGLFYFLDALQLPSHEYWHDMKFWWPHNEAIIACLYAWVLTGEKKYQQWFWKIDDWSHSHFPDRDYPEWFGYLHRDGSLSSSLKGNMFKGPFHIPRMYMWGISLLKRLQKNVADGPAE